MSEIINFNQLFINTHDEYIENRRSCRPISKHDAHKRYLALLEFVSSHSYWSRFHLDTALMVKNQNNNLPHKNVYIKDEISGKYLNEIHQSFCKFDFYKNLYSKVLTNHLENTNYQTLKTLSVDSFFVRNINGENLNRNPFYNNKSGIKVHLLVDSCGAVLSFLVTDGIVNDSVTINELLNNILIDKILFKKHIKFFLADSAYSGLANVVDLTSFGFHIIMGRNKSHIKKNNCIPAALLSQINKYKQRGIVENSNGQLERYPILLNNIRTYKRII